MPFKSMIKSLWRSKRENPSSSVVLQKRVEQLESSNEDMLKQLSEAKRLALSMGFESIQDAQAAIDGSNNQISYKQCFERVWQLEVDLSLERYELSKLREGLHRNFPLDADTTHRILLLLPNLPTLFSFILSSRFVHGIFQTSSDSIIRTVVSDQLGDVLPQALRLARYEGLSPHLRGVENLPEEAKSIEGRISYTEARILTRNAVVVQELEDHFSWRCKDRTSKISMLTPTESKRFRRAMYRIMLISSSCGMGSTLDLYEDDNYGYHSKQEDFLKQYSSLELNEIHNVSQFLLAIARVMIYADRRLLGSQEAYDFKYLYLFAGPRFILESYKAMKLKCLDHSSLRSYCFCREELYEGFILSPLKEILKKRGDSSETGWTMILDTINGEHDKCTSNQCNSGDTLQGVNLYNETNWDDVLQSYFAGDPLLVIEGQPSHNLAETPLATILDIIGYSMLMDQLFNMRKEQYEHWSKEKWVCRECLQKFILDTMPSSWLNYKRKAQGVIIGDCCYGYICPKQIESSHAKTFNHLCEPLITAPPELWQQQ